ncbi:sulfotransferase family protein [Chitinimonas arctica]|uniref:Sulfotransferase family protein n=1 Tax=Chitinimonas arctica TaxID=2594795 RepID=A0A516SKW3_9NEIS|nr:sulfotransferase family protein [Chitinimonas arctica]QDQ28795.1 sulfotransferase family protein [Chitinimonas arctica]
MDGLNPYSEDFLDWLPIRVAPESGDWRVDWCRFGRQALRDPFFRGSVDHALRLPFNQAFRRDTSITALLDWQQRSPGRPPTCFIFHASRCGSTLMAQMLARLASHTVLSEPPTLDTVLRAHYFSPLTGDTQLAWTRALLSAYGQQRLGSEQALVVKLDAWNIFDLPLLQRAFPDTPWLFLYRDPLEIAVSQLRAPGAHMVPGMIGPSMLAFPQAEALAMSRPEFIARCLGRILAAGLARCQAFGGLAVNYEELPDALTGRLAPLFDLRAADLPMAEAAARQNAKQPDLPFEADRERKRREAAPELIAQVNQWARGPYQALEALRKSQLAE